ncbi:helix-turn-helix domain-containing protein [Methylobacterium radiotolerans]|uniref:helix-turn-helix domain-containing protein n=1 Tax=Methylobacterium radiotolerans TaxID=31998 RepID=UPI001F3555D0|nr:helix-turn-helix domain-containing protein [Methylobacterium radiotolerans]UIY40822.1 helix-turn-helix domain-containing protein [Methylobacterium radiotolerans]
MDVLGKGSNNFAPKLISVAQAAAQLGVHPKTVRAHFGLVRIGDRVLVRVADVAAKISGGHADVAA